MNDEIPRGVYKIAQKKIIKCEKAKANRRKNEITKENSITAVPTSWLHGSICFWPPFSPKIVQAAIERGDPPNINTWQQFDYLALRNNVFDSFKEAERKSRKALETSDLESQIEDNDESIGKRKRRVPKHFGDDHSCSSEDGNTRTGTSTFLNHEDISIQQLPTTSNRELSTPQNSRSPHVEKHNCGDIRGNILYQFYYVFCISQLFLSYLKQILRKQNILQCMVTDMNTKLIEIENFVKTTPSHATEAVEVESIFVKVQNLPVDSDDALQELENFLADHNEFNEAHKNKNILCGRSRATSMTIEGKVRTPSRKTSRDRIQNESLVQADAIEETVLIH
ncbi:hypothetical protein FQA39_LY11040 [Lamprigera yunnana]|nr:hypothetical protein FQA39_LY11040 [Lamprigera yunnana]